MLYLVCINANYGIYFQPYHRTLYYNIEKIFLLAYFSFSISIITLAQHSDTPQLIKHRHFLTISRFKDGNSKPFTYCGNVYLRLHNQFVFPNDSLGVLTFNNLADTDTINLVIKYGRRVFSLKRIAGWYFRDGAYVAIGTIPKLWKLKSIAQQDEYSSTDAEYSTLSKRYRIAPEGNTIDLTKITNLKSLSYVTCCSYSGQCIMTYQAISR